ncbi:hypothetical protein [Escherichia phage REP7]|uniref:Uncharacterized protein n=1 Tax=Escherichia phage REP5 TaxID=3022458 RepID=A0AAE9WM15_9CAUD|nr:hypothetical protein [Escherichia phage REP5]WBY53462.1 hypothetical protein [Escherichia phage REP6]WBY53590.1 hypothetical protein [Escherichia phage REP7]
MLTVSFNYNSDGSVSINSPYANDLLKELVNQCERGLHYVQNSFKQKTIANNLMRVTVTTSNPNYDIDSGSPYSLVALGELNQLKLVCHDSETFLKVFSNLIHNNKYSYVDGSVNFYPANYTCLLIDNMGSGRIEPTEISFDVNSSPDAETGKNFDMSYALSLSKKSEFIDYVNGFGFKFDESMNLKKLKNLLKTKA